MAQMDNDAETIKSFWERLSESERTVLATLQEVDMALFHCLGARSDSSLEHISVAVSGGGPENLRCGFLSRLAGFLKTNEKATFEEVYAYLLTELGTVKWDDGWKYIPPKE